MRTAGSTTGSAWRNEQRSAIRVPALTDCPLERYNALVANALQVNHLGYETVARTELLNATLCEMDVTEINDLLMITQVITTVRANYGFHWVECNQIDCRIYVRWIVWVEIHYLNYSKSVQLLLTECTAGETHWQLRGAEDG